MLLLSAALAAPMTPAQAQSDLDAILAALQAMYIDPTRVADEGFQSRAQNVRNHLGTVTTTRDFWLQAAPLVASLNDGHTYLMNPIYTEGTARVLPIAVDVYEDKLWLVRADDLRVDPQHILTVDEVPSEELVEEWTQHFPGETSGYRASWISNDFQTLYPWWTGREEIVIELDGDRSRTFQAKPVGSRTEDTGRGWELDREDNLVVLQIRHFGMRADAWSEALDGMFEDLAAKPPKALVLDVRGNSGGSTEPLAELLPRLVSPWQIYSSATIRQQKGNGTWKDPVTKPWKAKKGKPEYEGPVYVLTDASTFSTGVDLAATLSDLGRAKVVGEVPGGLPTSTGNKQSVKLPSGLVLEVATARFVRADPSKGDGPLAVDLPSHPEQALAAVLKDLE